MPRRDDASTACPVCGSAGARHFTEIDGYSIFRCRPCGHGFLHPLPPREEIEAAYKTGESAVFNSNAFALLDAYDKFPEVVRRHFHPLISLIESSLPGISRETSNVLEAGCSTGVLLRCMADAGYKNLAGVELNPAAASEGASRLDIPITCSSMEEYGTDKRFDLIIAYAVIEHTPYPVEALRYLSGLLAEGGAVFLVVPNFDGALRRLLGDKWLWYMPPFHLHHFTIKSMEAALEKAGFSGINLTTRNTGTNSYLVHHAIFGGAKTQGVDISNPVLFRAAHVFDRLSDILFLPITLQMRAAGLGAHIVATATMRKPR